MTWIRKLSTALPVVLITILSVSSVAVADEGLSSKNNTDTATPATGLSVAEGSVLPPHWKKPRHTKLDSLMDGSSVAFRIDVLHAENFLNAAVEPSSKKKTEGFGVLTENAWSIAGGIDVLHSRGSPYLELRYSGQRWRHWSAYFAGVLADQDGKHTTGYPRMGVELYETWFSGRLTTGLGLTLAQPDLIVGTSMRYQLRFEWCWMNGLCAGLNHESNCRSVCNNSLMRWMIPSGADAGFNRGYNFIVLRKRL